MDEDALTVGKKCLLRAERYAALTKTTLTIDEIDVLDTLRDHVSMIETKMSYKEEEEEEGLSSSRRMCSTVSLGDEENDDGNDARLSAYQNKHASKLKQGGSHSMVVSITHRVERMRKLMRLDGGKESFLFDDLDHHQQVLNGLSKIFKVYARGNSLHASTKSQHHVAVDGRQLDMDEFLLGGPYITFEGFLFLCHDFHVTPRKDGKGNRKLNTRAGESFLLPDILDAQIIFIMSTIASHPILKTNGKF